MSDRTQRPLALPAYWLERRASTRPVRLHEQEALLAGLRQAREMAGLTIVGLALRTGLSPDLLGQLEARLHAPSPRTWARIASALGVEPARLLQPLKR